MIDRIAAAGNLAIEMKLDRWRLLTNGGGHEEMLIEAVPGQPLRYVSVFAQKRRLPDTGQLTTEQIQRVVLGWSVEDETWHLGLLLSPELSALRGSRWCEIARWPDPDTNVFRDMAVMAGQSLADTINRPFNLIPPQLEPQPAPPPPPPPLPDLPISIGQWTLHQASGLRFTRSRAWARARLARVIWYTLLALVYIVLSLVSLQGSIALPKPEFLPYLALAVAVILLAVALFNGLRLLRSPNEIHVEVDGIRALRGKRPRWSFSRGALEAVYVSQIVDKHEKRGKRGVHFAELTLYLTNGQFRPLLEPGEPTALVDKPDDNTEAVVPLSSENALTDWQVAAAYIAQTLHLPGLYDRRLR